MLAGWRVRRKGGKQQALHPAADDGDTGEDHPEPGGDAAEDEGNEYRFVHQQSGLGASPLPSQ